MSNNWVKDIAKMHKKFGVNKVVETFDSEKLKAFMEFRIKFLQEELDEMKLAFNALNSATDEAEIAVHSEDIVDALIDLSVVSIGTLDAFKVDSVKAWDSVLVANMSKEVGIKEGRPNPLGLPDLCKPQGWQSPTHSGNVGLILAINISQKR